MRKMINAWPILLVEGSQIAVAHVVLRNLGVERKAEDGGWRRFLSLIWHPRALPFSECAQKPAKGVLTTWIPQNFRLPVSSKLNFL